LESLIVVHYSMCLVLGKEGEAYVIMITLLGKKFGEFVLLENG
jgi:hypothetical protein